MVMGLNFEDLKKRGKTIELERVEDISVQCDQTKMTNKKRTVTRERIIFPNKQSKKNSKNYQWAQSQNYNCDRSSSIDTGSSNLLQLHHKSFKSIPEISPEFIVDKYSSLHKFACISPRYTVYDTICRPHMRTIGSQKDFAKHSSTAMNNNNNNYNTQRNNDCTIPLKACSKNQLSPRINKSSPRFVNYDTNCRPSTQVSPRTSIRRLTSAAIKINSGNKECITNSSSTTVNSKASTSRQSSPSYCTRNASSSPRFTEYDNTFRPCRQTQELPKTISSKRQSTGSSNTKQRNVDMCWNETKRNSQSITACPTISSSCQSSPRLNRVDRVRRSLPLQKESYKDDTKLKSTANSSAPSSSKHVKNLPTLKVNVSVHQSKRSSIDKIKDIECGKNIEIDTARHNIASEREREREQRRSECNSPTCQQYEEDKCDNKYTPDKNSSTIWHDILQHQIFKEIASKLSKGRELTQSALSTVDHLTSRSQSCSANACCVLDDNVNTSPISGRSKERTTKNDENQTDINNRYASIGCRANYKHATNAKRSNSQCKSFREVATITSQSQILNFNGNETQCRCECVATYKTHKCEECPGPAHGTEKDKRRTMMKEQDCNLNQSIQEARNACSPTRQSRRDHYEILPYPNYNDISAQQNLPSASKKAQHLARCPTKSINKIKCAKVDNCTSCSLKKKNECILTPSEELIRNLFMDTTQNQLLDCDDTSIKIPEESSSFCKKLLDCDDINIPQLSPSICNQPKESCVSFLKEKKLIDEYLECHCKKCINFGRQLFETSQTPNRATSCQKDYISLMDQAVSEASRTHLMCNQSKQAEDVCEKDIRQECRITGTKMMAPDQEYSCTLTEEIRRNLSIPLTSCQPRGNNYEILASPNYDDINAQQNLPSTSKKSELPIPCQSKSNNNTPRENYKNKGFQCTVKNKKEETIGLDDNCTRTSSPGMMRNLFMKSTEYRSSIDNIKTQQLLNCDTSRKSSSIRNESETLISYPAHRKLIEEYIECSCNKCTDFAQELCRGSELSGTATSQLCDDLLMDQDISTADKTSLASNQLHKKHIRNECLIKNAQTSTPSQEHSCTWSEQILRNIAVPTQRKQTLAENICRATQTSGHSIYMTADEDSFASRQSKTDCTKRKRKECNITGKKEGNVAESRTPVVTRFQCKQTSGHSVYLTANEDSVESIVKNAVQTVCKKDKSKLHDNIDAPRTLPALESESAEYVAQKELTAKSIDCLSQTSDTCAENRAELPSCSKTSRRRVSNALSEHESGDDTYYTAAQSERELKKCCANYQCTDRWTRSNDSDGSIRTVANEIKLSSFRFLPRPDHGIRSLQTSDNGIDLHYSPSARYKGVRLPTQRSWFKKTGNGHRDKSKSVKVNTCEVIQNDGKKTACNNLPMDQNPLKKTISTREADELQANSSNVSVETCQLPAFRGCPCMLKNYHKLIGE